MEGNGGDRHARRRRGLVSAIVIVVLVCVAAVTSTIYGMQVYKRHQAEERLAQLAALTNQMYADNMDRGEESDTNNSQPVNEGEPEGVEKTEIDPIERLIEMGIPIPEKEVDFAALQEEINEDIYAWIYIPDNVIDYPVLQHPTDNTFYLENNIDGSKGYPGCIYTENYNSKHFTDRNTVMYGHNMKNGTMFASLHKFEDSEYFEEHPYIYIYTEEGLLVYEVFAAYETGNEHILFSCDFGLTTQYSKYLEDIYQIRNMNANIKEDLKVTTENRILTLSTCVSGKSDRRYLVQGVLLNES